MSELKGYEALQRRFDAIKDHRQLMGHVAGLVKAEASVRAPVKTGNLRRSIRIGRVTDNFAEIVVDAKYAAMVERGTRPHIIVPRNRKVLAWGGSRRLSGSLRTGAKATTFARRVNHPGTRAKPFLLPGAQAAIQKAGLVQSVIKGWNEAA